MLRRIIAALLTCQPEPARPRFHDLDECRAYVLRRDAEKASRSARKGWDTRRAGL